LNPVASLPGRFRSIEQLELLGHRLSGEVSAPGWEDAFPNGAGLVAPPIGKEEYRVLNSLLRSGQVQTETVNGYSPLGQSPQKRARFWKCARFLKVDPDLLSSYAVNNAQSYPLESENLKLPLLESRGRLLQDEVTLARCADSHSILGLSRVGFSGDGRQALVYAQSLDGLTQATGMLVRLELQGETWKVLDSVALWIL